MKNKTSLSLLGSVALLCLFSFSLAEAYIFSPENTAPGTGSIYLSYNAVQSQGDILAIDVRVNTLPGSNPAIGTAFDLDFDPNVLTYVSNMPGNFFELSDIPENGNMVRLVAAPQGIPGSIIIGISQNNGDPGASGSGVLLTLKFRVASVGQVLQSPISFSLMNMIDVQGQPIEGLNWYNCQVVQNPLEIVTAFFPQGTQGGNITLPLTPSGGFPPYTWSITAGSFAPGLSLNADTGVITGTPTESGNYSATVFLTDASAQGVTRDLTMIINPAPQILTSALAGITISQPYSQSLSASGGTTPLTWDILTGVLPYGITLDNSTGVLSGTPSGSGTFSFTARISDSNGATATRSLSITVNQGVSVATASLPETTAGAVYNSTLQVQGGSAPYIWTVASGLPTGLSLMPDTGEILGIPSSPGNWSFTVTVTDNYGAAAEKILSIMVNPSPAIDTASVSNLYQDSTGQGTTFAAAGGVSPYTWSVTAGSLPTGLVLDSQNGTVSGTPSEPGIYTFTMRVTDAVGISASTEYQWVILANPPGNVDFVSPGSVNRVDGYDLIAMDIAFNTTKGSAGWNPFADLDGDNDIDEDDLLILQGNFGKSN